MQSGVESCWSGRIFLSSPVLTADRVKNQYRCAWLVYLSGVILLCSFFQLRCWAKISWRWSSCLLFKFFFRYSTVGWVFSNSTQHSLELWSWELLWAEVQTPLRAESNCVCILKNKLFFQCVLCLLFYFLFIF